MTDETPTASNRQRPRDSLFLNTEIVVPGVRDPIMTRVRNLSATGMMIDGHPAFEQGVEIETDLRGVGKVVGRIAWAMPERAGVAFSEDIDPLKARISNGKSGHVTYANLPTGHGIRPVAKMR